MLLQIQSVIYLNEPDALVKAIKSLKQAICVCKKEYAELQVRLVYGDASPSRVLSEEDVAYVKTLLGELIEFEYIIFGFNSGTAKGHNIIGNQYASDYMMIMNPDIIVEPECILKLLKAFDVKAFVGMTEARQTPLEHAKEYSVETGETEWASTACTIIKTSIFHEISGFDEETFFLYCDDLDFSWRLRLCEYTIIYVPSAIAYHAKFLSSDGNWKPTSAEIYFSAEAAILLAYKWSHAERAEHLAKLYRNNGGDSEKKAAAEYERRKKEGRLPKQLDGEHKIGKFLKDDYCEMRFYY